MDDGKITMLINANIQKTELCSLVKVNHTIDGLCHDTGGIEIMGII